MTIEDNFFKKIIFKKINTVEGNLDNKRTI